MTNYNSQGFKDDKNESIMYQTGKKLADKSEPIKPKESFFRMTLKAAFKKAFRTVVIPTAKRFIDDVFEDTKNSLLYGDDRPTVLSSSTTATHTPYSKISTQASRLNAPYREAPKLTKEDHAFQRYDKCRVLTEDKAFQILNKMYEKLRREGKITLAFYYQQFGETYDFTDENWGWRSMAGADCEQTDTGYRIIMPKIEELN